MHIHKTWKCSPLLLILCSSVRTIAHHVARLDYIRRPSTSEHFVCFHHHHQLLLPSGTPKSTTTQIFHTTLTPDSQRPGKPDYQAKMHFSVLALLVNFAITPIFSLPTQVAPVATLFSREENTQAVSFPPSSSTSSSLTPSSQVLTAYYDPLCAVGPTVSMPLPLPPNFTSASNASQSICHPLPPSFRNKEFFSLNFGSGEDAIPCGLSLFKDEACTEYATKNWYRRDASCKAAKEDGGPWGGVSFSGCWGPGTPNGKSTDDPNVDPNEES